MKTLTACAMLLALGAPLCAFLGTNAQAKIAPLESQAAVTASDNWVSSRSAETREAEYFRAPPPLAERNYPCRLQMHLFEKTRLAQSC
jgi:hypothetical protein